jgi:hypothetical protein
VAGDRNGDRSSTKLDGIARARIWRHKHHIWCAWPPHTNREPDNDGQFTLVKSGTKIFDSPVQEAILPEETDVNVGMQSRKHGYGSRRRQSLKEKHASAQKEPWGSATRHGFNAFWAFCLTSSGFLITVYGLNIVVRCPLIYANIC